jgi:2-amino-4-hydroxy-6-hydroxymethyldihydropteridine diphosphokinase
VAQRYLIALGSNVRHHRHGAPHQVLGAAIKALGRAGLGIRRVSPVIASAPLGPSRRRYANGVALVKTGLPPDRMLDLLKAVERDFGRRPGGQRWGSRVLDLDLVLWSGGAWSSPGLTVPHVEFRERGFVLDPACAIAPQWRDPVTGLSLRQLAFRRRRARPVRTAARQ